MPSLRVIGPGRAGLSLGRALAAAGWDVRPPLGRGDELDAAAAGIDVLVIATPDSAIADVAGRVASVEETLVIHLSGSLGLDVLAPHRRRASVHPLVSMPDAETGATALRTGAWFAVAGDPEARSVVQALDGHVVTVDDDQRAAYHAAACIASNHLVALLGQVERIAAGAGVPLEAYLPLVRQTVDNVAAGSPSAALTGPVARGDLDTIERHLAAIPVAERRAYEAMVERARALGRQSGAIRLNGGPNVIDTVDGFAKALDAERAAGRTIGLVPTMGYLHEGHASLMRRAAADCDIVAVSIFVNPLQFGAGEDLSTYPRDVDRDLRVAAYEGVDYVFAPSVEEMYPGEVLTSVSVAELGEGLEGASRPTHFDGVATVVAKLFAMSGRCRAYFGEKDWQQLAIVRRMARDLSFPVDVIGCPIVREPDGLAMSSRNVRLNGAERAAAPVLSRALTQASTASSVADARRIMAKIIEAEPMAALDYAEAIDGDGEVRLLVAARFGTTRLIDNARFIDNDRTFETMGAHH